MNASLDACVLYAFPVADTLLRLAEPGVGLYSVTWSDEALREMERVFLRQNRSQADADRRLKAMRECFPDATVEIGNLVPSTHQIPDENDRHVLDAAAASNCDFIVTFNLKDFPDDVCELFGLEAISPDDFLCILFAGDSDTVMGVLREQADATHRDVEDVISHIAEDNKCRRFAQVVSEYLTSESY